MKLRRIGALAGAFLLTFGVVGSVFADSGSPTSIDAQVNGHTVTVSGNWTWEDASCNDSSVKIVGWAVAWGEPGWTNNPVPKSGGGNYYMGDDVQGNTVTTLGQLCKDFPGAWGPLSHTYAEPGNYDICVIIYDLRADVTSGAHSNQAGGDDRNTDNSVEENFLEGQSVCQSAGIVEVPKVPGISIDKTVDDNIVLVGATVTYSYLVTNTGEIDLDPVTVVDDNGTPGNAADDFSPTCPATSLAVGEHMTCTKSLVAGPAGTRTNIAVADGTYGEDQHVSDSDDASVLAQPPGVIATQAVGGETNVPTGPPTDTIESTTSDAGGTLPLLLIIMAVVGAGALVLTPRRARR